MTTDRLAIRTYATGAGVPLVLLPGFPLDSRIWDDVAGLLPPDRTVVAVDPPGLGRSPAGEVVARALGREDASVETAAEAVADALHAVGIERAVVAGLSMGGYLAMALAELRPALVAGLALVDTRSTADDDAVRANRLRMADAVLAAGSLDELSGMPRTLVGADHRERRPDLVDRVAGWIGDQTPVGVAWSQRAMAARPDRTDVLVRFDGPALVVVGVQDEITPVAAAEHRVAALADAELVVVPGAGHLTSVEAPGPVAAALERLAGRVDAHH